MTVEDRMTSKRLWTEGEVSALKRLYPVLSIPVNEIASRLNRTERAVSFKAGQLGLPRGRKHTECFIWTRARVVLLRSLRKQGLSYGECAKRLGAAYDETITRNQIAGACWRHLKGAA